MILISFILVVSGLFVFATLRAEIAIKGDDAVARQAGREISRAIEDASQAVRSGGRATGALIRTVAVWAVSAGIALLAIVFVLPRLLGWLLSLIF